MPIKQEYSPIELTIRKGQISSKDPSVIPLSACSEMVNMVLDKKNVPTKSPGLSAYNTETGTNTPVKGSCSFVGEDNIEYNIKACNNKLYWTNGNGIYTAIKFKSNTGDVVIDTANYDYEFLVFPKSIGGTQSWVIYVFNEDYPVCNNTPTTGGAIDHAALAVALRLQIDSGVIIAKLIYNDPTDVYTAGADEIEVGTSVLVGWPKQAPIGVSIFDRGVFFYDNYWIASLAQNIESFTPSTGSNIGGGKQPAKWSCAVVKESTIIAFTRKSIVTIYASPSALTNWREVLVTNNFGCISKRSAVLHSDGWVYFITEQGVCRTDGRIAEKTDYDIEDFIKLCPQLTQNKFSWEQTLKTDFDGGLPTNGDGMLTNVNNKMQQKITDRAFAYSAVYGDTRIFYANTLDFGITPSAYGTFVGTYGFVGTVTQELFIASSDTDLADWSMATWVSLGAATVGANHISLNGVTTYRRYMKIKWVVTSTEIGGRSAASITSTMVGAQWVSAVHDIGYVPNSWGVFDVDFSLLGQTVVLEIASSYDGTTWSGAVSPTTWSGWITVLSGTIPALTLLRYFRFRITLDTDDYTQLPYVSRLTQYWFKNSATNVMPCMFSHEDRIYLSIQSPSGTTNDVVWIGQTRVELEERTQSKLTGAMYPEWTKIDYMKANVFIVYRSILCLGDTVKGIMYQVTGNTNKGAAFTSYIVTGAITFKEVESIFREAYIYSKSDQDFNLYIRTRRGVNGWSAWSTAKVIALAPLVSRSVISVFAGLTDGDYAQLMLESTTTDANLEWQGILLYVKNKERR